MLSNNFFQILFLFILSTCSTMPISNSIEPIGEAECTLTLSKTVLQIINSAPTAVSTVNVLFSDALLKVCYINLLPRMLTKESFLPQQLTTGNGSNLNKLPTPRFTTPAKLVMVLYYNSSTFLKSLSAEVNSNFKYYLFHQLVFTPGLLFHPAISPLKFKAELVLSSTKDSSLSLWNLCFYCDGGQPKLLQISSPNFSETFKDFYSNMNGSVIRVVSSKGVERSIKFRREERTGEIHTAGGFGAQIFLTLQEKHKFQYVIDLLPSFSQLASKLQTNKADFTFEFGVIPERQAVLHLLPVIGYSSLVFFTKQPSHATDWSLIRRPFDSSLWIGVGVAAAAVQMTHFLLSCRYSGMGLRSRRNADYVLCPLVEQSIHSFTWRQKNNTVRCVTIAWIFTALILCTGYKAKLTNLRAQILDENIPVTFEQLAESDYEIYLHYLGGFFQKILNKSTNPVIQKIAIRVKPERSLFSCFQFALRGQAACISMDLNGVYNAYSNFSDINGQLLLKRSADRSNLILGAGATRKDAVFGTAFSKTVRNLIDMGLVLRYQVEEDRLEKRNGKFWARERLTDELWRHAKEDDGPRAITVKEFLVLIITVGALASASALILVIERLHSIMNHLEPLLLHATRSFNPLHCFKGSTHTKASAQDKKSHTDARIL